MKTIQTSLLVASFLLSGVRPAAAAWSESLPQWSMPATSCNLSTHTSRMIVGDPGLIDVLDEGESVADMNGPRLGFRWMTNEYYAEVSRGQIVALCPVSNPMDVASATDPANPRWNNLVVGYTDPSGLDNDARVGVKLVRVSRSSDTWSTVAEFTSDQDPMTSFHEVRIPFRHNWDFRNNSYYVEIYLDRNSDNYSPHVTTVRLLHGQYIN